MEQAEEIEAFSHNLLMHFSFRMDPTLEQWKEISDTVKKHKLIPFFDSAYQVSTTNSLFILR